MSTETEPVVASSPEPVADGTPFNLTKARILAGFSKKGLAKHLSLSESIIAKLESDEPEIRNTVRPWNAKTVADHFGVTVLDLQPGADQ